MARIHGIGVQITPPDVEAIAEAIQREDDTALASLLDKTVQFTGPFGAVLEVVDSTIFLGLASLIRMVVVAIQKRRSAEDGQA